ncbi:MAG: hypothetical protein PQJ50_10465 [Spirochaetales bacterium]|nr:hypothetical protein [Spirochaetales bacterium]
MEKKIEKQIGLNKNINLFSSNLNKNFQIDNDFIAELLNLKIQNKGISRESLRKTRNIVLETLYGINQYINVQQKDMIELEEIYKVTFDKISTVNVSEVMIDHYQRLSTWLSRFYPNHFINQLREQEIIGSVLNEEYSADFQIYILDLVVANLDEPIIDIGCGKTGNLPCKLKEMGKDAVGIDRIIEEEKDYLIEKNWFDFYFENEKWGTIISNMSFVNHLLYTYENDNLNLEKYLIKFKEILDALKPCGRFIYTPSIPFLENYLDGKKYRISRDLIINGISRTLIERTT